ncbi:predicted protein [Uncinocarpus reesii 1704]|uniref:RBR-type E3 ubiquitin transferase n=1 Tax=Uncinocarpus reesii (strain UAMH 1704) TaxID=336963 RepID=C4JGQ0_UNCRE|nr:uncharacterized protein UREG_02562 [Uncinocarpus reesii 1704]EEP77713.1 predicted protein [Uncinocarpus reesii 1704]
MSVSDPQHMPPRCCTNDHIPLKHVDKLFDTKFKNTWNRKYQEYTTKNRLYCPSRGCGEWIKPNQIYLDTGNGPTGGRKYGKCSKCKTKVCVLCNGKMHRARDCPKDEDTKKFNDIAKDAGWKRCYNCSAMVELKEGCNHMTCRCTAEFCIICGAKWKTCECPWFNYTTVHDDDILENMNIPQARREAVPDNEDHRGPIRYQQEMDRRREQEQEDEVLARRLQQVFGFQEEDDDDDSTYDYRPNNGQRALPDRDENSFPPIYDNFYLPSRPSGAHTPPPPDYQTPRSHLLLEDPAVSSRHEISYIPRIRTQTPDSTRRRRRRKQALSHDVPSSPSRVEHWRMGLNLLSR